MAPVRYSLHYEDYSEHLMSRFGKLLQMQSLVDMTLMCSSHTLRVHKAVLAASSAYFQDVLQKQTGEPLIILKMRFNVLKCLVEFMYCGKTQCLEENLDELVSAAQFLQIKGLSKVTKEGLGITNHSELPVFAPPVVINQPPQSILADLHSQVYPPVSVFQQGRIHYLIAPLNVGPSGDSAIRESKKEDNNEAQPFQQPPQVPPVTSSSQAVDSLGRPNKDNVIRIPFDIENASVSAGGVVEYSEPVKPRRGRPSMRQRPGASNNGWETGALGRAAERALMRREQDSRKAIHQLKHLQSRHVQDYMERVTLSQAVHSICDPESTSALNYMNIDNNLMYMDQPVSSNVLNPNISYSKEHPMANETVTSSYPTAPTNPTDTTPAMNTAMSQYVNALKSAGLPTDLPILFESGDGSYINVNEQVLLDMVQSSEIQYEVIEQPNIIEKVADPSEIKSIDDLSKSIERGEMLMRSKPYANDSYAKDPNQYSRHEEAITNLNSILPDDLDSLAEQQNFVVLDPRLQESNNMDQANEFSCIDGDMQFFTKSMSDDVKKYYTDSAADARVMEQLCPTSTNLDTNFSISLLDSKISHLGGSLDSQYNPLNAEDLRRNEDCYDFGLQLPNTGDFKDDALDCLMATPERTEDQQHDQRAQERDEIIQDLINIENNINHNNKELQTKSAFDSTVQDFQNALDVENCFSDDSNKNDLQEKNEDMSSRITSSGLRGDSTDNLNSQEGDADMTDCEVTPTEQKDNTDVPNKYSGFQQSNNNEVCDKIGLEENKENRPGNHNVASKENDIPFAVGLLPLKQMQTTDDVDPNLLKRKTSIDDLLENVDAKCLKRKVKFMQL